ncbi:menin [Phymastichus coffea]|uniref:menin n=1 Tax=Phymastichus coffea TaxID=108790 RepID=UPI00273AE711|nr:menin [Phymastichus coffea]XP_058790080.1 menin [Phymastichus coffea]XP_058790081.1 menin [Phymastichus coffea]
MVGFLEEDKGLFPLQTISSVVQIFQNQLENSAEPDLALLSIIVGAIENPLTCNRNIEPDEATGYDESKLPPVDFEKAESMYTKFTSLIKNAVDLSVYNTKYATRELVKKVSDSIWNYLSRNYNKDHAHLQSIYSYLTLYKLDCFGAAFAVVAGCQVLGFNDVHLALSEDHAWVVFGENGQETAEVTWHGKGNEDKRGQPVDAGVASKSWVYLNGQAVVCDRAMEVATIVSAINPSFSATADAVEVALLQQELLWLLYDLGHLKKYPMALGNLGELEEAAPTPGRPAPISLFQEAVQSARKYYDNAHVYPYTYQGGYLYRHGMHVNALALWADAADVLRKYNYCRDDGEIYKELLEIANELIPHVVRADDHLLRQPRCFAYLLRFYDGICHWEEGANTPVLHIGWARPLVNTISKFDASIRAQVMIDCYTEQKLDGSSDENLNNNNNNYYKTKERCSATRDLIKSLESKVPENLEPMHPGIQALAAACGEKILNRDYLLQGDGEPFVAPADTMLDLPMSTSSVCGISTPSTSQDSLDDGLSEIDLEIESDENESPRIMLYSQKMKGLKDLLLAEKLNTHAVSLQLTAQSQVQVGKKTRGGDEVVTGAGHRPKRTRRE